MLQASCHCGSVQLEISHKPETLTECTCSICHRYGAQWAYYTRRSVQVICAAGTLSAYRWGDKTIDFYHCTNCGCVTHYNSLEKDNDSRIAVNARMMKSEDIASAPVRLFDGASTWRYLDG